MELLGTLCPSSTVEWIRLKKILYVTRCGDESGGGVITDGMIGGQVGTRFQTGGACGQGWNLEASVLH